MVNKKIQDGRDRNQVDVSDPAEIEYVHQHSQIFPTSRFSWQSRKRPFVFSHYELLTHKRK
ncbi:MAG: hypothetical protein ABIY51_12605 [Ferruginibacter sp.]